MSHEAVGPKAALRRALRSLGATDLVWASVAAATGVLCWLYGGPSASDDTFISMRYVGNALAGRGFVFNPGEASAGVTSPLWAFLMTGIAAISSNELAVWKVAGCVAFAAAPLVLGDLFTRTWKLPLSVALPLVAAVVLEPHTFRWASSGMENGLTVLLLAIAAASFARLRGGGRPATIGVGVASGLMPWCRPELALASLGLAAIAPRLARQDRRRLVIAFVASSVAAAALTLMAFSALVPQTAGAKAIFLHQSDPFYGLRQVGAILASGALPAFGAALMAVREEWSLRWWRRIMLGSVAMIWAYMSWQNHLVSTRYATTLSFVVVLTAALIAAGRARGERRLSHSVAAVFALQITFSVGLLIYTLPANRVNEHQEIARVVDLVASVARPDDRVAITEVGAFGYLSDVYVIDLVGLNDQATLAWGEKHGPVDSPAELEALLLHRGADLYVDAFAAAQPLVGERLQFQVLGELPVRRRNLSRGRIEADTWRVYRLLRRDPTSTPAGATEPPERSTPAASAFPRRADEAAR